MSKYVTISAFVFAFLFITIFMTSSFTTSSHAQFGDEGFPNTVFTILPESPGANCANGGTLIASGYDFNGSGFLETQEVQQIGYACNGDSGEGIPGPEGPQGADGPQGPQGAVGAQGPIGATGPQGPQGDTGPEGVAGADGANGQDGTDGEVGAIGPEGPQGEQGLAGVDGQDGVSGIAGADGISCWDLNGNGTPESNEDINGDGFFNSADCIGPEGLQGLQGDIGPQGPAGPQGAQGDQGIAGADGATGPAGTDGSDGTPGVDGAVGATGPAGADGADGAPGVDGAAGPAGADGVSFVSSSSSPALIFCPDGSVVNDRTFIKDLNGNGVDDSGEPTAFVIPGICDGADGVDGVGGAQGLQGLPGFDGTNGADGVDGFNAVFAVTTQEFGAPCPNGEFAKQIWIGTDLNRDGELDFGGEVVGVVPICDGEDGAQGPAGGAGTWSYSDHTCSSNSICRFTKFCPEGTIFANVSCGHNETDSGSKIWVKYAGGSPSASASRVAICTLSNDQNTDRLIDFGAYCVDE